MTQTLHSKAMDALLDPPFADFLVQSFYIGPRDATYAAVPEHLQRDSVGRWIAANSKFAPGMWKHQAIALNHLHQESHVVVTTSTGSGKSDIAKAHILYMLGINAQATAIGFFPAKALQTDQFAKLQKDFADAGYSSDDIGVINGDEKDHKKRLEILGKSRFVLMTPDVLHAWVLDNLREPEVRKFLSNLGACFIDEAHIYDRILGSHGPGLFRRLRYAADTLKIDNKAALPLQFIAASASLKNAPAFMENLTGCPFIEIGPDQDGSRKYTQDVVHLGADEDQQVAMAKKTGGWRS